MTVVVVGSSGGGTATLGHTNVPDLLTTIHMELQKINNNDNDDNKKNDDGTQTKKNKMKHGISLALFVSCDVSMDSVNPDTDLATLWTVGITQDSTTTTTTTTDGSNNNNRDDDTFQVHKYCSGMLLKDVNEVVKELAQQYIVPVMTDTGNDGGGDGKIQGLIGISCDPVHVNRDVLAAAVQANIPMTGSGGSSLAAAIMIHGGLRLVGNAGGSVATTTYTRAVSYGCALSHAWNQPYSSYSNNNNSTTTTKPSMRSILDACLPSFLAVCVTCRFLDSMLPSSSSLLLVVVQDNQNHNWIDLLRFQALPSVCAVVAATSLAPEHGSTAIMASVVSSMSCHGSIASGLLAGWLVSLLLGRVLFWCIRWGVPATMTNIIVAGFVGSILAVTLHVSGMVQLLSTGTAMIRALVRTTTTKTISGCGFVFGGIFCYGSKVGWYHSIFLPIILIEMEHGNPSLWGSVDQCVLVMVSAGICAATILTTTTNKNKNNNNNSAGVDLPKRGLIINLLCGDFIEVAYPYMEQSKIVNFFAYLASGISTEILYQNSSSAAVSSSAYLPLPISILLAKDHYAISLAMLSAFTISFLGMCLNNITIIMNSRNHKKEKEK